MIQLALIGMGVWGRNFISTINSFTDCRIKYVCSKTTKTLKSLRGDYIKTTHYEDLFNYSDIDGVIIATPSSTHFRIAKEFLERGLNVLIEKPLTTNYKDALVLKNIVDKNRSIAMVGHVFLYHPAIVEMKRLVKKMTKIHYISCESMDYGPIRYDASALWDWAPHDISIVLNLLETNPISVSAWASSSLRPKTDFYDMCFLKLTFPEHISVFMFMGWLAPVKKRNIVVAGEKNSVVFDDVVEQKLIQIKNLENKRQISYPAYSHELPLTREILEFAECIRRKRKPKTTIDSGVEVIKIIEKAEESIKQNGKDIKI